MEHSITAEDVTDRLDVFIIERAMPTAVPHGQRTSVDPPIFISKPLRGWAIEVELVLIPSGQTWRNRFIGFFNRRLRDECLSVNRFYSLSHAKGIIGMWKRGLQHDQAASITGVFGPSGVRSQFAAG